MSRAKPRYLRINANLPAIGAAQGAVVYKIVGSIEGQMTVSTFSYFGPNFSPTLTQLNTLLTAISGQIFAAYKACLSSAWTCTEEQLVTVHRNDIVTTNSTANAGAAGSRGTPALPTQVAAIVFRSTAIKGQHGRGRLSLPAVPAADVTSSHITGAGLLTALAALAAAMVHTGSDGTNVWSPAILQRSTVSPRLAIGAAQAVNFSWSTLIGTIRRRKIGRGK